MNLNTQKYAIITGGSSGIGWATAKEFARNGVHLFLIARKEQKLLIAKSNIQLAYDVNVEIFPCDVRNYDLIKKIIHGIGKESNIDYLVICAGRMICGRIEDIEIANLKQIMEINYIGALNTYKAAISVMRNQKNGQIGFVSSVAGFAGAIGYGGYAPGKFALTGLAECVRMEARDHGIGTTIIYPSDTDTPFLKYEQRNTLPESKALSRNAKIILPERVAKKIVTAMFQNKFEVFCNIESKMIRLFKVISPALYYKMMDRIVKNDRIKRGVL